MWVMKFPELLEQKYLQWQTQQGKGKTLDEFAEYIGVGRPVLSNWLTGKRKPGVEVQQGFEDNLYTSAEAAQRLTEIENGLQTAIRKKDRHLERQQTRAALLQYHDIDAETIERFILEGNPTQTNRLLRALIQRILLTPDLKVIIEWR